MYSQSSQKYNDPSVPAVQINETLQKLDLNQPKPFKSLRPFGCTNFQIQSKLYTSEKIYQSNSSNSYESHQTKMYSAEEDDVLDAIVEWQSV